MKNMTTTTFGLWLLVNTAYATPNARYAATEFTQQNGSVLQVGASVEFMPGTYHVGESVPTQVNIDARQGTNYAPITGYKIQLIASPASTMADVSDDRVLKTLAAYPTTPQLVAGIEHDYGTLVALVDDKGKSLETGTWNVYTQGTISDIPLRKDKVSYDIITILRQDPLETPAVKYSAAIDIAPTTEQIPTVQPGQTMMYIVDPKTEPVVSVHNYEVQVWLTPAATLDDTTDDILVQDIPVQLAGPNPNLTADGEHQRTMTAPTAPGTYALYTEFKADEHVVDTRSYHRFTVATSETHLIQK